MWELIGGSGEEGRIALSSSHRDRAVYISSEGMREGDTFEDLKEVCYGSVAIGIRMEPPESESCLPPYV